jgi:hypothetical protein
MGLTYRFEGFDIRADALLSTVTLPQFRLRWLEDNDKKNQVRSLLHEQVRLVAQQQSAVGDAAVNLNLPHAAGQGSDEEFFCFSSGTTEHTDATVEVDLYLSDNSREIDSLHKFPLVKKVFEKYNTPLPSSAPVERLFSLGGQILTPRRNRLSDSHFERQALLRANRHFLPNHN